VTALLTESKKEAFSAQHLRFLRQVLESAQDWGIGNHPNETLSKTEAECKAVPEGLQLEELFVHL